MRFHSTRGDGDLTISAAIQRGLAEDGGLFVPAHLPAIDLGALRGEESPAALAAVMLAPFFAGDPLEAQLAEICADAFSFDLPSVPLAGHADVEVLELFHGPTAAFKDVGARFLAACFERMPRGGARTILVATSGDTGGAVAAAFDARPGIEVGILFPDGGVSKEQQHQLTCWSDNVRSFAVRGTFDDCQRVVKAAFADEAWRQARGLTTANSINIARLLPQAVYYAHTSLAFERRHGRRCTFVVPSGNVGNATAGLWAKHMGFPIERMVMVTNANRTVPDYLASGDWQPRASQKTLANAMDVGDPSNMERVFHLYGDAAALRADVAALAVEDTAIRAVLEASSRRYGRLFDPHTATAVHALEQHPEFAPAVLVSTAHPAKFQDVVAPIVGQDIAIPASLQALFARESRFTTIEPDLEVLKRAMDLAPSAG